MKAIKTDYQHAELTQEDRAMLDFVAKLTRTPAACSQEDFLSLRSHGFSEVAIHDIVQITALFNYFNRLADGLGLKEYLDTP